MDALRLAAVLRAVRIRKRWRQLDVARAAGFSRATVTRAEGGRINSLQLGTVIRIATALDVRLDLTPRWRGGELDRVLNPSHSAMHDQLAILLGRAPGWRFQSEVSYAIYGERGFMDVLAFHPERGSLLVVELKTDVVDIGGLIAQMDRYLRLAARVAAERGWRPRTTSGWLVIRDTSTNRRRISAHASVMRAEFPANGRDLRRWLRDPGDAIRALSFLTARDAGAVSRRRVRRRADR